ncbi:DUF2834 domain-containing protein [Pseudonocardiaceae bacterium YIM PH 21723]|nr:DUF2834 domain-containing protein [Pseudonocardiaceae bacterium YIM PH 21723]
MRTRFLLMATILGFLLPNIWLGIYAVRHGLDAGGFLSAVVGTVPATQFTIDLGICLIAFFGWSFADARRIGLRTWWHIIPATFLVGLCFGIPLYLYQRERLLRSADQ